MNSSLICRGSDCRGHIVIKPKKYATPVTYPCLMLTQHDTSGFDESPFLRKSLIRGLLYLFATSFLLFSITGLGYWLEVFRRDEEMVQFHTFDQLPSKKALLSDKGKVALPLSQEYQQKIAVELKEQIHRSFKYKPKPTVQEQLEDVQDEPEDIEMIEEVGKAMQTEQSRSKITPPSGGESFRKKSETTVLSLFKSPSPLIDPIPPTIITSVDHINPESLNKKPAQGEPCGLENDGNFCYFNSVLQCFAAVFEHMNVGSESELNTNHLESFRLFVKLLHDILAGGRTFSTWPAAHYFRTHLEDSNSFDGKSTQQDCSEVWLKLYDLTDNADFKKVFSLVLQKKYELLCGHDFIRYADETGLILNFPPDAKKEKVFYLEDLIEMFLAPEKIEVYKCETCGKKDSVTMHPILNEFPKVLAIVLKRFLKDETKREVSFIKLYYRVVIPEYLELGDQVNTLHKYRLKATSLHSGTFSSGHYIAIVRYDDNWITCNDRSVSKDPNLSSYSIEQGDPSLTGYKQTVTPGTSYSTFQPYFLSYVLESSVTYDPKTYVKPERPPIPDDPPKETTSDAHKANWRENLFGMQAAGSVGKKKTEQKRFRNR